MSAPIGAWEVKLKSMTDRQTDRQTDRVRDQPRRQGHAD